MRLVSPICTNLLVNMSDFIRHIYKLVESVATVCKKNDEPKNAQQCQKHTKQYKK